MTDRKTLKIQPPTAGRFERYKRAGESQTAALARLLDDAGVPEEPEFPRCDSCGTALGHGFVCDDGRALCFDCADLDHDDYKHLL